MNDGKTQDAGVATDSAPTSGSKQDLKDMDIVFSALCFCLRGDESLGDFFDDLPSDEEELGDFDKAIIDIQRLKMKGWCLDNGYDSDDFKKLWNRTYSEKFPNKEISSRT